MAVREMAMRTGKGKAKELILECQVGSPFAFVFSIMSSSDRDQA
jgi:hypothetical protein